MIECDLSCNRLGDPGCVAVADALEKNTSLKVLRISRTGVGPKGAFTLGFSLQHRDQPLDELDFSGNRVGAVGARSLLRAVRDSRGSLSLDLANCDTTCKDADVFDDADPEGESNGAGRSDFADATSRGRLPTLQK